MGSPEKVFIFQPFIHIHYTFGLAGYSVFRKKKAGYLLMKLDNIWSASNTIYMLEAWVKELALYSHLTKTT